MDSKQTQPVWVFYYIPEDLDELQTPNAFKINKPVNQIKPKDIQENFPLKGCYIFRFRHEYEKKKFIWLDLNQEAVSLPLIDGKIFVKATRISWDSKKISNANSQITQPNTQNGKATLKQNSNITPQTNVQTVAQENKIAQQEIKVEIQQTQKINQQIRQEEIDWNLDQQENQNNEILNQNNQKQNNLFGNKDKNQTDPDQGDLFDFANDFEEFQSTVQSQNINNNLSEKQNQQNASNEQSQENDLLDF